MHIDEKIKSDIISKTGQECGVMGFWLKEAIQYRIALGYKITSITLKENFQDGEMNIYTVIHE